MQDSDQWEQPWGRGVWAFVFPGAFVHTILKLSYRKVGVDVYVVGLVCCCLLTLGSVQFAVLFFFHYLNCVFVSLFAR